MFFFSSNENLEWDSYDVGVKRYNTFHTVRCWCVFV